MKTDFFENFEKKKLRFCQKFLKNFELIFFSFFLLSILEF
jgi:hypothetical protein